MKTNLLILFSIISLFSFGQVSQNILVEHYTNTRCSTCASKNPAFFSLLEDYDEIHLAYYPSSPFSSCIFSMHNKPEADNRTNYYGIFGGTPRVVINGEVVPAGSQLLLASRIDAEVPNMTAFTIEVNQEYENENSVKVNITIKTISSTNLSSLTMQAMIAEKKINYNAPNGETEHFDVFRKSLYGLNGENFTVPANGDSISFKTSYTFDPDWVNDEMEIIVFIQDESDKSIKQATVSKKIGSFDANAIKDFTDLKINILPN